MRRQLMFFINLILLISMISLYAGIPRTISYQGVLTDEAGNPVRDGRYKLKFELHTTLENGQIVWEETQEEVMIERGLFNVILGSVKKLDIPFDEPYFLAISVNDGRPLQPFSPLTSSPYALGGGDGAGRNTAWSLNGNTDTDSLNFIGTIDEQPLEIRVKKQRVLLLEPTNDNDAPNIISGSSVNSVESGVVGATISGGGDPSNPGNQPEPNLVSGNYGTVGGGYGNNAGLESTIGGGLNNEAVVRGTIGGGRGNRVEGLDTFIGGGLGNTASGSNATIGGGSGNEATGDRATVSGGVNNTASNLGTVVAGGNGNRSYGLYATVGGGNGNKASHFATVPGGNSNQARGSYSFAAGRGARAAHNGTFVWSDSNIDSLVSSGEDQFLINAAGGVGIGTNNPDSDLTVAGVVESTDGGFKFPDGSVQTTAASGGNDGGDGNSLDAADGNPKDAVVVDEEGNVGIGTEKPVARLDVAGDAEIDGDVTLTGDVKPRPYTRYFMIPAGGFNPAGIFNDDYFVNSGYSVWGGDNANDFKWYAAIILPHNAQITGLKVGFFDEAQSSDITVSIVSVPAFESAVGQLVRMAEISSSGSNDGIQVTSTSNIQPDIINNKEKIYYVEFSRSPVSAQEETLISLRSVLITYTISTL